jgi:hypothetical protein
MSTDNQPFAALIDPNVGNQVGVTLIGSIDGAR